MMVIQQTEQRQSNVSVPPHTTLKKPPKQPSPFEALPTILEPTKHTSNDDICATLAEDSCAAPISLPFTHASDETVIKPKIEKNNEPTSNASLHSANGDETDNETDDESDDDAVKCIFLCEFHATAGPKIAAQVPANYITKELFDTVNRYIIPKLQLQRSFLSVSLLGKKILGYPVRIDNKLYARNAFYFNFCFVFAPQTRTVVYEPVVRKLTEYMLSLESSSKLLSQTNDEGQITRLTKLLAQIRRDINKKKMCMLQEGSTIIPLCVVPHNRETPIIHPHGAAVLNSEFHKYTYSQWDLTTLRILPYVNGFNHINRISAMADVALALVIDCIKHLVLLGVAIIVPVFQYSNVYRPTPKLSQLAKCKLLQRRCIERCSKSSRRQATVRDIFRMFASMAHGATFGELCVRFNPAQLNINEKQMVLFGLLEGLIRRVDKYPITVSRNLFIDDEDSSVKARTVAANEAEATALAATAALSAQLENPANNADATITTMLPVPTAPPYHKNDTSTVPTAAIGVPLGLIGPPRSNRDRTSWPLQRGTTTTTTARSISATQLQLPAQMSRHHTHQQKPAKNRLLHSLQHHQLPNNGQPPCYYNGLKSLDEICCSRGISCQQLEVQLARDRHVIVLLK